MAFYWYEGQKIELSKSTTHRAVRCKGKPTPQSRQRIAAALGVDESASEAADAELDLGSGIFLYKTRARPQTPSAPPPAPESLPEEASELTVFAWSSGTPMILTEEFNVQFKPEVTRQRIDEFNAQNKVRIVCESTWEKNGFLLAVQEDAGADALTMANRYYDSGLVLYSGPNFLQMIEPAFVPDDRLFAQQWALRNTGQAGGIAGQDIRAVDAWEVSLGSPDIIIAVLDDGVDYTHPDLNTPGKLVPGYNAMVPASVLADDPRRNDPNPVDIRDDHGTPCAGIAAAAGNNGIGISGVAPGCRLMGVKMANVSYPNATETRGSWSTSNSTTADAIATAVNRRAAVLSNSWGGGSPADVKTNAIRHAKNNGRDGRGCVVCFATGNENGPVNHPANLPIHPATEPQVVAVAACNQWGEHKSPTSSDGENWGSNFGPQVDVCAPGVAVRTTSNGGGYRNFNGTSAATPHVAGVAALILSVNPTLTAAQVENILRETADDLGPPGFDHFTGHGRVNAHRALQRVRADMGQLRSQINAGETLLPGQCLDSPNRRFSLFMRRGGLDGGNLELVGHEGSREWATSTQGNAGAYVHFENEGNFVLRTATEVLWSSGTRDSGATYGLLEDNGHFTLYTAASVPVWSTRSMLSVGVRLELPRELSTVDNRMRLRVQPNGNLELLGPGSTLFWDASTAVGTGAYAELVNGNFVVRVGSSTRWESGTVGSGAVFVQVEEGCFTLRRRDGTEVWSTYRLYPGGRLTSGQYLASRNGQFQLRMQPAGTLEFRNTAGRLLWASPTNTAGAYAELSGGNVLVRNASGVLWGTSGRGAAYLQLENDGYFALYRADGTAVWTSRSMLSVGATLQPGEELVSLNEQFRLRMQPEGVLEYREAGGRLLWTSGTAGNTGAFAELLADGNFVLRLGASTPWASRTAGRGAVFVQAEDEPYFTLRTRDGTVVWTSRSMLTVGVRLNPGEELVSLNGTVRLRMQPDGNLELLRADGSKLWTSFTPDKGGAYAELLPDGNLILQGSTRVIWMSLTAKSNATYVQVHDVGHFAPDYDPGSFALHRADGSLVRRIP